VEAEKAAHERGRLQSDITLEALQEAPILLQRFRPVALRKMLSVRVGIRPGRRPSSRISLQAR
jgi:hypothetical protein